MANLVPVDMSQSGGVVTVILAKDFGGIPEPYDTNPQVYPLNALDLPQMRDDLNEKIPKQTKIVMIAGKIPAGTYGVLQRVLDMRSLVSVPRNSPAALSDAIRKVLAPKEHDPVPALKTPIQEAAHVIDQMTGNNGNVVKIAQARGAVSDLLKEADLTKGSAEEGRRLFRLAQQRGIATTLGSLTQGVSNLKRKGGRTETPRSLMSDQQNALKTLDEAIAALQLIRDYVDNTEQLNVKLELKLKKFKMMGKEFLEE